MNAYARLGLAALCVVAAMTIASAQDEPRRLPHVEANQSAPADGPYVVAFLERVTYNATRDATLAGALVCSHKPCGPLVWIKGNVTGGYGPFLLEPTTATLTHEEFPLFFFQQSERGPNATTPMTVPSGPIPYGPMPNRYDRVRFGIAEPFEARPSIPIATGVAALRVAPLALLGLLPEGVAWWRRALVPAGVVAGAAWGFSIRDESWGILAHFMLAGPLTMVSAVVLVGIVLVRKRLQPEVLALVALGFAFFLALSAGTAYSPPAGWGD